MFLTFFVLFNLFRKLRKEQMQWEHQRLFQVKNTFMDKQPVPNNNLYGQRELSNGNSNCTYSTEDGAGYLELFLQIQLIKNLKSTHLN